MKIHCAHDAEVAIADLKPNPANPNKHPESQIALLAKIIKAQGWRNPIVVSNRSGLITKGHGRLEAARQLGATMCPVDYQDYASEKEELADMIADNRIAELAEADRSMLRELADQLDDGAFDMDLTGFDHDALEELMTAAPPDSDIDAEPQIDKAEELRVKWGVERGQIWELGDHRIMCGDSSDVASVKQCFNGNIAVMGFTDPPYGVDYQGHNNPRWRQREKVIINDALKPSELQSFLTSVFKVAGDFVTGDFYVAAPAGPLHIIFDLALRDSPFEGHQWLIWVKDRLVLGRSNYHYRHEHLWYGWKRGSKSSFVANRTHDSVWEIPRPGRSDDHPTMKPVALVVRAITNSSISNRIVYEPFSGSGTTIIACEQLGRKCRAMEIDPGYVAVSIQRWADATGKTPKLLTSFPNKGKDAKISKSRKKA